MGVLLAVAAGAFFGLSNITVRQGQMQEKMDQLTGLFVGVVVNNILNLLILAGLFMSSVPLPAPGPRAVLFFTGAGLMTSFVGRELLFKSIRLIGPSRAVALKVTAPITAVVLGVAVLGERLSGPALAGIGLVLAATYYISLELLPRTHDSPAAVKSLADRKRYRKGLIAAVLAGLALGTGSLFRKLGVTIHPSPVAGVSVSALAALFCLAGILARQRRLGSVLRQLPRLLKGGYLWTGVLTSLALYATYGALLFSPVSIVNSIKASEPLFTLLGSLFFLRSMEAITARLIALTLLAVLGVALIAIFS